MTSITFCAWRICIEFLDEVLVGLQRAQQFGKARAGAAELLIGAFGIVAQPAPLLDEEGFLLRLEAGVLLEFLELVARPRQRLVAESGGRLPLSATAPSKALTASRRSSISFRAVSTSV